MSIIPDRDCSVATLYFCIHVSTMDMFKCVSADFILSFSSLAISKHF